MTLIHKVIIIQYLLKIFRHAFIVQLSYTNTQYKSGDQGFLSFRATTNCQLLVALIRLVLTGCTTRVYTIVNPAGQRYKQCHRVNHRNYNVMLCNSTYITTVLLCYALYKYKFTRSLDLSVLHYCYTLSTSCYKLSTTCSGYLLPPLSTLHHWL